MDDVLDILLEILAIMLGLFLISTLIETLVPSLKDAIKGTVNTGIKNAASNATQAAVTAVGSAAQGALYGLGGAVGATPDDVNNTFAGNPTSPGYDFIYGPDKFSLSSLGGAFSKWWQITTNPALDSGASGPSAGAFPLGTDVTDYNPGNWDDTVYAPPPPSFTVDSPTQNLLNYLGAQ